MRRRGRTVLTSLLFVDIVGSTAVAEELGDRRWRELLHRYHRVLSDAAREFEGKVVDTAGDGLFARFDAPAAAIRCAVAAAEGVRALGIEIRAGVHIGECEVLDGKLSGVNVHAAARTMGEAGAGEVVVTGAVRDLTRGAGIGYADRGVHELRGIEGDWHLFAVTSVDGGPLAPPAADEEARARRDAIAPPPFARRRDVRRIALVAAIVLLVLAAAAGVVRAVSSSGGEAAGPLAGCLVTPHPPLNDRSFNQAIFDGLTDAATKWGISVRTKVSRDFNPDEWRRHVDEFAHENCALITTVGGEMADVTSAAARADPNHRYLTTDVLDAPKLPNLAGIRFRVDQAAFQAGYAAAARTKTGKVGTFGFAPAPGITLFMKGFTAGVLHYNRLHGTDVKVLGWDPARGRGLYVTDDPADLNGYQNYPGALHIAEGLIREGADIIFPVDGPTGDLAAGEAADAHGNVLLIGVDSDQFYGTPKYASLFLTSVRKIYKRMVYVAMGKIVDGDFRGGILDGTLENGGVDLAPFRAGGIAPTLRAQLEVNKAGIESGKLSVDPRDYLRR